MVLGFHVIGFGSGFECGSWYKVFTCSSGSGICSDFFLVSFLGFSLALVLLLVMGCIVLVLALVFVLVLVQ